MFLSYFMEKVDHFWIFCTYIVIEQKCTKNRRSAIVIYIIRFIIINYFECVYYQELHLCHKNANKCVFSQQQLEKKQ